MLAIQLIPGDFGSEGICSSEDAITIWTEMPACQPRDTIIEVPQMLDAALFQVRRLINDNLTNEFGKGTC